jgi:hypothetical protein
MKKTHIFFCLFILLSQQIFAFCGNSDLTLTIIKSTVSDIKHSKDKLTISETKNGLIKKQIFYRNKEIVMIRFIETDLFQNLNYVKDWYFDCKRIIYAEQNIYIGNTEKSIDFEAMYFLNEKLYQWLTNNHLVDNASTNFKLASLKLNDFIWKMKVENGMVET